MAFRKKKEGNGEPLEGEDPLEPDKEAKKRAPQPVEAPKESEKEEESPKKSEEFAEPSDATDEDCKSEAEDPTPPRDPIYEERQGYYGKWLQRRDGEYEEGQSFEEYDEESLSLDPPTEVEPVQACRVLGVFLLSRLVRHRELGGAAYFVCRLRKFWLRDQRIYQTQFLVMSRIYWRLSLTYKAGVGRALHRIEWHSHFKELRPGIGAVLGFLVGNHLIGLRLGFYALRNWQLPQIQVT